MRDPSHAWLLFGVADLSLERAQINTHADVSFDCSSVLDSALFYSTVLALSLHHTMNTQASCNNLLYCCYLLAFHSDWCVQRHVVYIFPRYRFEGKIELSCRQNGISVTKYTSGGIYWLISPHTFLQGSVETVDWQIASWSHPPVMSKMSISCPSCHILGSWELHRKYGPAR